MFDLATLGFGPFFENQIQNSAVIARVSAEHRGGYRVISGSGDVGAAVVSGRLAREQDTHPTVGDFVTLSSVPSEQETVVIESILKRSTAFIRGAAGRRSQRQVVAANIDVVFIVCGLDNDYNLRRIERYLARVFASGAQPVIVLNKSDLCMDLTSRLDAVQSLSFGVDVLLTNAVGEEGIDEIRDRLPVGVTGAFVGSSGAGKSSLINALLGRTHMPTAATRERDGRGCHTTTHRQLIHLQNGGILIDTPGMREIQLYDEAGIDEVFSDIESFADSCRFRDCSHQNEPGCAVLKAVDDGELPPERLANYHKMKKEARAYTLRKDAHQKRRSEKVWGQLHREVARLRRWKEG